MPEEIDVELVLPGEMKADTGLLGLTRCDWVLLGIGSGAVLVLTVIGLTLMLLLRS